MPISTVFDLESLHPNPNPRMDFCGKSKWWIANSLQGVKNIVMLDSCHLQKNNVGSTYYALILGGNQRGIYRKSG